LREVIMSLFDVRIWEKTEAVAGEGEMVFTLESIFAKNKIRACTEAMNFYREFFEIEKGNVLTATARVVR